MKTVLALLSLIPSLIATIRAVEEAIPGSGAGEAKLALIREIMESAYSGITDLWPAIEKAVALIVATLNKIGEFKN